MASAIDGLGAALRLLRKRAGLQQLELALRARISAATLNKLELEKRLPDTETLGLVLTAMGASAHDLAFALDEVSGRTPPPSPSLADARTVAALRALQLIDTRRLEGYLFGHAQNGTLARALPTLRESAAQAAREAVDEVAASLESEGLAVAEPPAKYSSP